MYVYIHVHCTCRMYDWVFQSHYKSFFHRFHFFVCIYSLAVIFIIATTEQIKQLSAARKPHPLHVHLPFTPCDYTPSDSFLIAVHTLPTYKWINCIQEFEIPLSNYEYCTRSTYRLSPVQQCSTTGHCKSSYLTSRVVFTVTVNSLVGIIASSKLSFTSRHSLSHIRHIHTYAYPLTQSISLGLLDTHHPTSEDKCTCCVLIYSHTQGKSQWWYLYPARTHTWNQSYIHFSKSDSRLVWNKASTVSLIQGCLLWSSSYYFCRRYVHVQMSLHVIYINMHIMTVHITCTCKCTY